MVIYDKNKIRKSYFRKLVILNMASKMAAVALEVL